MNPDLEYFQHLADGAPIMIWLAGKDMGCFHFNRAWLDFRGRTLQQEFGNGWAEGVHPEDLERCIQHYIGSFEKRLSFAMSYRLRHHSGDYRWILDRGVPHHDADGNFLGYYGGCAETSADATLGRIQQLHSALNQLRDFANERVVTETGALRSYAEGVESLQAETHRLVLQHRARQHAAAQIGKLAQDMLAYDQIPKGACL
ncbi:MAG TPA: PAS domain-containing protein [Verrucomicrobiae bacterium]|nr:PAS domain-containing protein [Verrucomicrobiae bacterium]